MDNNTKFSDRFKSNILGYILALAIGAGGALFFTQGHEVGQDPYPPNGNPPEDLLSPEQMGDLYYRYADKRSPVIDSAERRNIPDFEAVRSVTFEYQDLKNYIAYIENNSVEAKATISGLRFYYGKYRDDKPSKQKGRQVLFFNPTVFDKNEQKDLAYAIDRSGGEASIIYLKDIIAPPATKSDTLQKPNSSGSSEKLNIKNEASVLSFFNFSTVMSIETQGKNGGGQQSPPPYNIE